MRYKCKKCNLYITCDDELACKRKCIKECHKKIATANPYTVENQFGPMLQTYSPNLKKMYDLVPNNQPDDYNILVASTNPVNYTTEQQGLGIQPPMTSSAWSAR